jgi:hypothetical protein
MRLTIKNSTRNLQTHTVIAEKPIIQPKYLVVTSSRFVQFDSIDCMRASCLRRAFSGFHAAQEGANSNNHHYDQKQRQRQHYAQGVAPRDQGQSEGRGGDPPWENMGCGQTLSIGTHS